jgi:hypothetical protein
VGNDDINLLMRLGAGAGEGDGGLVFGGHGSDTRLSHVAIKTGSDCEDERILQVVYLRLDPVPEPATSLVMIMTVAILARRREDGARLP